MKSSRNNQWCKTTFHWSLHRLHLKQTSIRNRNTSRREVFGHGRVPNRWKRPKLQQLKNKLKLRDVFWETELYSKPQRMPQKLYSVFPNKRAYARSCSKGNFLVVHIVWKLLKMSHFNFWILAFSTNFCPIKTDLSSNTVWPQALGFQKLAKMHHFWHF